ncbi:ABC-2 type transporter-domain-containing protein [Gautieria morchelliformis]|nr:ABC-2 type transporter-domain-containing protein [Gautieria morchelliformis]
MLISWLLVCFAAFWAVASQSCENYGTVNGSICSCPPGFGGPACELVACGGTLFSGSNRPLAQISSNTTKSNLTSCSCEAGWGGTGCNVCTSSTACQNAFNAVKGNQPISPTSGIGPSPSALQNNSLTCNVQPTVYASGEMSCQVLNPTLQALFPLMSDLTILRTLNPSLSPLPNTTSFGPSGSIFAQLIYSGVEQFYCTADNCTQSTSNAGTDWNCQDLRCTCKAGTSFCGGQPGALDLTQTINTLSGALEINCANSSTTSGTSCSFNQQVLRSLFGQQGLSLSGCTFGECVAQSVIDATSSSAAASATSGKQLSGGVIAGLAVVGAIISGLLVVLIFGKISQRRAAKGGPTTVRRGGIGVRWEEVGYVIPIRGGMLWARNTNSKDAEHGEKQDGKVILDALASEGVVAPGEMLAILGPSGAGKTTLVEILAGKRKGGKMSGKVEFFDLEGNVVRKPRIGFVDQADTLPATLTPRETLLFAARLRLPESVPLASKVERVSHVLTQLGLENVADVRIGSGERRGISGGEMRRVSLGCELVAGCDVVVLDEPTSGNLGLDSVSAAKVASVLYDIAHDPQSPTAVIASVHQPNSKLYMTFSHCLLLSRGHTLYSGPGGFSPAHQFASQGIERCPEGYNVADWLLEVTSGPESIGIASAFSADNNTAGLRRRGVERTNLEVEAEESSGEKLALGSNSGGVIPGVGQGRGGRYATTFLTQFEVLAGREWKTLKRDKTLFVTHVTIACVLGVFVGGLYFNTGTTIAGFQSRVGCLFFLGALIAFSSLSALYNLVEVRPLFLRERAASYYSPTAWLLSRIVFDVIPLRIIPTIVVSTITYWMAGLAHDAAHFFKFLLILVLYSIAMTLFNFLLACLFRNGGVAILLSALTALYQQTYAGFFVHLGSIPSVLRWLQWLAPLKYTLEALSVNEVGSGLMIEDTLQGVPVSISASLIMDLLFGFGANSYYRDVLVLFAFIAGFGLMVIFVVWFKVRERR